MHAVSQFDGGFPAWQADAERRLRFCMVVATAFVAMVLSVMQMPTPRQVLPLIELIVELKRVEPVVEPLPDVSPPPVTEPADAPTRERIPPRPAAEPAAAEAEAEARGEAAPVDWDVERDKAIQQVLDAAERESRYSVNPPFERARRDAAVRFRASVLPEERHIWDNVEKDQLGRTILRDGNCFRVLDDPNVTNRWAFENFDRYIVYCDLIIDRKGRELPWVEIIRERYPYLRDPVAVP